MPQTICALTSIAGTTAGYTFMLATGGNGFTAGELVPTPGTSPIAYNASFPSNIQAAGSNNTCVCFLPNLGSAGTDTTTASNPPYWFLMGAASNALWLGQINPSTASTGFSGSNIPPMTKVDTFDAAPVAICYVPALQTAYVATANGNLYSLQATWSSSGTPSFGSAAENKNFKNAASGAISIAVDTSNNLYVSGLTANNENATFVIPATAGTSPLGNGSPIPNTSNSIATAITASGIYTAFADSVTYNAFGAFGTAPQSVWTAPGGVTISTIAWSPNATQSGIYPQGVLFIATTDNSLYAYDPSTNATLTWISDALPATPYGMIADQNMNVLVQCGDSGVYFAAMVVEPGMPELALLVPVTASSGTHSAAFQAVEKLVFKLVDTEVKNAVTNG